MSESVPTPHDSFRITKVYTRTGDGGTTRLVGGQSIPKNHPRLAAYGTVDELQVAMGAALDELGSLLKHRVEVLPAAVAAGAATGATAAPFIANLRQHMLYLQNRLFTLSGDLATRIEDRWKDMPLVGAADVEYMEELIDALNDPLPPLKDFILPGGHGAVTAMHLCRVVCRRAEREVESLAQGEAVGEFVRPFLNRLSDVFFVLARALAHKLGTHNETIWRRDLAVPPLPE